MTLKNDMAADLTGIFLNQDEFADAARFYPKGDPTGFACVLAFSDPIPSLVQMDSGVEDRRSAQALGVRSVLRAGILALTTVTRDPTYGDLITVSTGAYAGNWVVKLAQADDGGGIDLALVEAEHVRVGAQGAQQVRS